MEKKPLGGPRKPEEVSDRSRKNFSDSLRGTAPSGPAQKIIAEHTVAAGETLSHISLKYYGSAVKDKWMQIYEANRSAIGEDPGRLAVGTLLKIPELKAG